MYQDLQRNRERERDRGREREELTPDYGGQEAPVQARARRSSSPQSKSLETQKELVLQFKSEGRKKKKKPVSSTGRKAGGASLTLSKDSLHNVPRPPREQRRPHPPREGNLLSWAAGLYVKLMETPSIITLKQISGHPMAQSSPPLKLAITGLKMDKEGTDSIKIPSATQEKAPFRPV